MANKVAATILYGSQNMGLSGPDSDKDYKILMYPTFNDLYNSETKHSLPDGLPAEHYSIMDLRQFDKLLRKGNPNVIELLYSVYQNVNFDNAFWYAYWEQVHELYENGYVTQVWPQFFAAVKGLVFQSLDRDYSRKTVSRAMFWVYFLDKIYLNNGRISADTWQDAGLFARKYRYNMNTLLPSIDEFDIIFETIKAPNWFTSFEFPSDLMYQAIKYEIIKGEYNA